MAAKKKTVVEHKLIPKHSKLTDKEKAALLEHYNVTLKQLPHIHQDDPGLAGLQAHVGDIIKIERSSPTAGKTVYYRSVIV